VGTNCARGSTLEELPLSKGYYRLDATSIDVRICPDAQINCSTSFGSSECESASGCQGGVGKPCANGLLGTYCLLCNHSGLDTTVYYKSSTSNDVAKCVACGDTTTNTVLAGLGALVAAAIALLLVTWFMKNMSTRTATRLKRINSAYSP